MDNPIENQPTIQTPTQPIPMVKKWYTDKAVLTMLVLVILAGLSLAVYFILNQPQNLGPIITGHKNSNNLAQNAPAQNTAGELKSYTNTQYGYEIQYPSDWGLQESGARMISLFNNSKNNQANTPNSFSLLISPANINDPLTWYTTYVYNVVNNITEKEDVTIAGVSGMSFCHPLGSKFEENWVVIHNGYAYEFDTTAAACDLSNKTLNDILATFKFTSNTSSSSASPQSPDWSKLQQYTIFSFRVPSYTPNSFYWEGPTNLTSGEKISDIGLTLKSDNNPSRVTIDEQSSDPAKAANKDLLNVTDNNYTSQGFKVSHVDINGNDALLATAYEGMSTQMVHLRFFLNGTEVFINAEGGNALSVNDIITIARSIK